MGCIGAWEYLGEAEKGLMIVYTGPGKGKTTAALGLALRVIGHGGSVCLVQFMKGRATGEVRAAGLLPGFTVIQAGREGFVDVNDPAPGDRLRAAQGWEEAAEALRCGEFRLVILDEVNVAAACGLVDPQEVLAAVEEGRAAGVDVVLTGRDAPEEFIARADLVTVMEEVKHPYRRGAAARAGIEY
ncbi:MAG TPA: cob(I)yrinic acid a,c-diamide adenosyltransferase [Firmicutes bacterium]|nr:cob(I)yrinic acid a,c-diamide adenosyltransferase [Bacillota bacterium]